MSESTRPQQAADAVAAVSGETPSAAKRSLSEFDLRDLVSAIAAAGVGGGNGGSQPHTQELLTSVTNIGDGSFAFVAWGSPSGDSLLDVTDPTVPEIVESGIYAFTFQSYCVAMTAGGYFVAQYEMDVDGADLAAIGVSNTAAAAAYPTVNLTTVMYLTAGMKMKWAITSHDGTSAQDFGFAAVVQRIG